MELSVTMTTATKCHGYAVLRIKALPTLKWNLWDLLHSAKEQE